MIVECIKDDFNHHNLAAFGHSRWAYFDNGIFRFCLPVPHPSKGDFVEVIKIVSAGGATFYELREYLFPHPDRLFYDVSFFKEVEIDISDINKKEITELPIEVLI